MTAMSISASRSRPAVVAALIVAAGGIATILGAYFFQYVVGVEPCELCLLQRKVYYVAIPLALIVAAVMSRDPSRPVVVGGLSLLAAVMLIGAAIAIYHSGVEWKFWAGPQECSGPVGGFTVRDVLGDMTVLSKVVRCDQATRFLGVSLANANIVLSLALAAVAAWGIGAERAKG